MKILVIGGARSGKSSLAARWAAERSSDVCCIVTAIPSDAEMSARIAQHQRQRPVSWSLREEPMHVAKALESESAEHRLLLIDCLTIWSANCLWPPLKPFNPEPDMEGWRRERDLFLEKLQSCTGDVLLVTNEVGSGIVPEPRAARTFRDEHGWLNQRTAAICDATYLVVAGLPVNLTAQKDAPVWRAR